MPVKSMLLRLENAFGQENLSAQMLLQPGSLARAQNREFTHLVIGYNGSPNSQTALDFTLWMAHQTRLATRKQVMVHVVYALQSPAPMKGLPVQPLLTLPRLSKAQAAVGAGRSNRAAGSLAIAEPSTERSERAASMALFEQADQVLWQARCLANEWRGSLEAHLCFGEVATELRRVVEEQDADLLVVGCRSAKHPLVQRLTSQFPCPVLGIPPEQD